MRHIERPKIRTQFIIFNLYGDYISVRGGAVWTGRLIEILSLLGVSERAARSTLSRMKRKGWLDSEKFGRESMYKLTKKGRDLLDEGGLRLFGPRPDEWDGTWHIVTYSLPQEKRSIRHQLRTRLSWLGYGMLEPGTMIAAYPLRDEVLALFRDLNVVNYVHFFSSARLELPDHQRIVNRCWDLEDLNQRYSAFINQYQERYESLHDTLVKDGKLEGDESFIHRFWATYEYSAFPRRDPDLPAQLLPDSWLGDEARNLLAKLRDLVWDSSESYVNQTLGIEPLDKFDQEDQRDILVR